MKRKGIRVEENGGNQSEVVVLRRMEDIKVKLWY